MHSQAAVVASSLSELGMLTEDEVFKVMSLLDNMNMTRVIVTDTEARIMFDTSETEDNLGKYAAFSEIKNALNGQDERPERTGRVLFRTLGRGIHEPRRDTYKIQKHYYRRSILI